jgi:hypothetical protein
MAKKTPIGESSSTLRMTPSTRAAHFAANFAYFAYV